MAARLQALWPSLLLSAVVLLTYWPVSGYDFVWDDLYVHLHANPLVTGFGWSAARRLFVEPWLGLYVPFSYLIWGTAWQAVPAEQLAGALHLLNLALHLLNALLVLAIARRVVPSYAAVPALAAALLFALHPVQVETVAWISELRALGAAAFGLLAVWLGLRHAATTRPWRLAALLALLTLAAGLFKPSAVVVPPATFLLLWGFGFAGWRRAALLLLPALLAAVALAVLTGLVQTGVGETIEAGLLERLRIAAFTLLHYLSSLFWPFGLSPLYAVNQATASDYWLYRNALLLVVLLAVAVVLLCRRSRAGWALVALFLLGIAPVSGLVPFAFQVLSYVADRYLYWSMLAVALAAALGMAGLLRLAGGVRLRLLPVGLLLLALAFVARFEQLPVWRDEPTLWRAVLERQGPLVPASNNLGRALRRTGQPAEAIAAYRQSLALEPQNGVALYGTALSALDLGDYDTAQAALRSLLEATPGHPTAPLYLARIEIRRGNYVKALEWLNKAVPALRASPDPRHRTSLAEAYYLRVLALVNLKEDAVALQEAAKALALVPDYGEVLILRAVAYARLGQEAEALADLKRALALGLSLDPIRHIAVMQPLIAAAEAG